MKNISVAISENACNRARVRAAQRDISVSALVPARSKNCPAYRTHSACPRWLNPMKSSPPPALCVNLKGNGSLYMPTFRA
jgi:hypothetical protein